jgi:hypothetical protein
MDLTALVSETAPETGGKDVVVLSSTSLESFWVRVAGDSYASRQGLQVFLDVVKAVNETTDQHAEFSFSPAGWEVHLGRAVAQVMLSSALLSGLLAMLGADQLPAAVLAAVIPLLFDIDRVSMEEGDRYLLARLLEVPGIAGTKMTREQLYARLPKEVREQTTLKDFVEFLDICRRIGQADVSEDGHVVVHRVEEKKFRVTFR